jgi:uncharacterized protein
VIELNRIEGFYWDEGNARKRAEKHRISQAETEALFFCNSLIVVPDPRHSQMDRRCHALGQTSAGRLLHIVFTLRRQETLIRVISARDMHRKERIIYAKETEAHS